MFEEFKQYLYSFKSKEIPVNIPGLAGLYWFDGKRFKVICVIDLDFGIFLSPQKLVDLRKEVKEIFKTFGYENIDILIIAMANDLKVARQVCAADSMHWLLDKSEIKLYIEVGQPEEFYDMRDKIAGFLREMLEYRELQERKKQKMTEAEQVQKAEAEDTGNMDDTGSTENPEDSENAGNESDSEESDETENEEQPEAAEEAKEPEKEAKPQEKPAQRKQNPKDKIRATVERERGLRTHSKFPVFTVLIILINAGIFFMIESKGSTLDVDLMLKYGAVFPSLVVENGQWYRIFTAMFLHFGFSHVFNNMIVIGVIGYYLEKSIGSFRYIAIYLVGGMCGNLASLYHNVMVGSTVVSAGASGAIFALIGALLVVVVMYKGKIQNVTGRQVALMLVFMLYYGISNKGIDNFAHIGGLVFGIVASMIFCTILKLQDKYQAARQ